MAATCPRTGTARPMPLWLEHAALRALGYVLLVVLWPFALLGTIAEVLTYVDPSTDGV